MVHVRHEKGETCTYVQVVVIMFVKFALILSWEVCLFSWCTRTRQCGILISTMIA
jgi:hypothetical protein